MAAADAVRRLDALFEDLRLEPSRVPDPSRVVALNVQSRDCRVHGDKYQPRRGSVAGTFPREITPSTFASTLRRDTSVSMGSLRRDSKPKLAPRTSSTLLSSTNGSNNNLRRNTFGSATCLRQSHNNNNLRKEGTTAYSTLHLHRRDSLTPLTSCLKKQTRSYSTANLGDAFIKPNLTPRKDSYRRDSAVSPTPRRDSLGSVGSLGSIGSSGGGRRISTDSLDQGGGSRRLSWDRRGSSGSSGGGDAIWEEGNSLSVRFNLNYSSLI